MTSVLQDLALGIAQNFSILFLQGEVAGDPLFIQGPEGSRVLARAEWPNLDLRKTRPLPFAHDLHPVVMHSGCPLTAVSLCKSITSNILFCWIKMFCIWIAISNCDTFFILSRLPRSCILDA